VTTSTLLKSINRTAILDLLRERKPISRSEIAERLHLSLPTAMRIIDDLVEEDLVRPAGVSEVTGGRPRPLIELNAEAYAVIGVDLGGTKMLATVADLAGTVEHEVYVAWDDESHGDSLGRLCSLIEDLLSRPRPAGQRIRGIGIGAPGITLHEEGIVTWAPSLGWRNTPLRAILSERFGLPVFVENDVNLAALGELGFGAGRGAEDMVSIAIGTGIGAGIVLGGALYRGHNLAAGEIGYLLPGVECLGQRYDGFGALESRASGTGIADAARRALREAGLPQPEGGITAEDVFAAAREGQAWAQRVVSQTVDYLSQAIVAVSALLDPQVIVLGGGVSRSADMLIEPIQRRIDGVVPFVPRLVVSPLGSRAAVMGAIMIVLNGTMDHLVVRRLP